MPPVSLLISWAIISRERFRASFTAARIRSWSISTSSGLATSGSMRRLSSSWRPLTVASTMPPPAWAVAVRLPSSACISAILACSFWACFIMDIIFILLRFLLPRGGEGAPEDFQGLLFEFRHIEGFTGSRRLVLRGPGLGGHDFQDAAVPEKGPGQLLQAGLMGPAHCVPGAPRGHLEAMILDPQQAALGELAIKGSAFRLPDVLQEGLPVLGRGRRLRDFRGQSGGCLRRRWRRADRPGNTPGPQAVRRFRGRRAAALQTLFQGLQPGQPGGQRHYRLQVDQLEEQHL